MERKIYDFRGVKVSLRKESYRTNGTLAVIMDEVYHASFRSIPEINLSVSSRKYMERWCPLFSEWRLDETIAREADVLAVVDKDVSDLKTGRNTVVYSSVVHIFPFCALPVLSCCRRIPQEFSHTLVHGGRHHPQQDHHRCGLLRL